MQERGKVLAYHGRVQLEGGRGEEAILSKFFVISSFLGPFLKILTKFLTKTSSGEGLAVHCFRVGER